MSAEFITVCVSRIAEDGSCTNRIWAVDEESAAAVDKLLGVPTAEQICSTEHMTRAAEMAVQQPVMYLDGGSPC